VPIHVSIYSMIYIYIPEGQSRGSDNPSS